MGNANNDNSDGNNYPYDVGKSATSNMGVVGQETNTVFFSQVPKNAYGWYGGVIVANATSNAGTCEFSFTGYGPEKIYFQGVLSTTIDIPLPAIGQISFSMKNVDGVSDGFNASVTATCTQKVFGVYNFSAGTGYYGDSYIENNGNNQ